LINLINDNNFSNYSNFTRDFIRILFNIENRQAEEKLLNPSFLRNLNYLELFEISSFENEVLISKD